MKMYDMEALMRVIGAISEPFSRAALERAGVPKAFAIRHGLVRLKHEVKDAMMADPNGTIPLTVLNERLQHLAKIPRPGLPKQRCNGRCRCNKPLTQSRLPGCSKETRIRSASTLS